MSKMQTKESGWRRILRLVHLWLGIGLLLPLIAIGISGSILVFNHEIAELTAPPGFAATKDGDIRPLDEILAAAMPLAPDGAIPSLIVIPEVRGEPAAVRFLKRGVQARGPGDGYQILLDPTTLEVFGERPPLANPIMRFMHGLHGNLLISGGLGRDIVGWFGIVMLVLGISGIVMWWPKSKQWRAALTITRGAKGYRFHRELHGALGIWTWIVFVVVSFSGVYIAFPNATGDLIRLAFPARDMRLNANATEIQPIAGAQPMAVGDAAQLALVAAPDARIWTVRFPARPNQPYRFGLIREGHEHGQPFVTVSVDPWKQAVVDVLDPRDYTTGETIMAWQRGIHGGEGLGWTWKILVFLSGMLPVIFGVTGCAMWLLRRRISRRAHMRSAAQEARP